MTPAVSVADIEGGESDYRGETIFYHFIYIAHSEATRTAEN